LFATNANAQTEQTAEGAQQFFAMVAGNGSTKIEIPIRDGHFNLVEKSQQKYARECKTDWLGGQSCKRVSAGSRFYNITLPPFAMTGATSSEKCLTKFSFIPGYSENDHIPSAVIVDWRRVTKAEAISGLVDISGNKVRFHLSSTDLATRFAFAATFLQNSCDPTASTGF
jgi:hypothetical protein